MGWVRADVAGAVEGLGSRLQSIESYESYACRGRNNIVGARISEHGKANALDIHAFKLTDGKAVVPTDPLVASDVREALRKSACDRFNTVLGPGSDGYHEDHVHVDLLDRPPRHFRLCQWDVREPEEGAGVIANAPLPLVSSRPSTAAVRPAYARNAMTAHDRAVPAARKRAVSSGLHVMARQNYSLQWWRWGT